MKHIIASTFLLLIFLCVFVIHINTEYVGPRGVKDLNVLSAFFDPVKKDLYLVRKDSYAVFNLEKASAANKNQHGKIPSFRNQLHYKYFKSGEPKREVVANLIQVNICERTSVSYSYVWKFNGTAQPVSEIVRSGNARCELSYGNIRDGAGSILSYTFYADDQTWPDARDGISFRYNPDYRHSVRLSMPHPGAFLLFGPSFLALVIATFTLLSSKGPLSTIGLFIVAAVLHGVSSFFLYVCAAMGWDQNAYEMSFSYFLKGIGILILMVIVKLALLKRNQIRTRKLHGNSHRVHS